jgi:D-alanyl-D-alanine carboxypeptidase
MKKIKGLTSLAWVVCDGRNGEVLLGEQEDKSIDPAGLTKLIVAFTVLQISRKIKVDLEKTML